MPTELDLSVPDGVRVQFKFEEKTLSNGWCIAMHN